jgi:hypothetical protein
MGQKRPVQVYLLVTEETIEENLLGTLAAKKDLALAALDAESQVDEVAMVSGTEELRNRLEVLLGAKPEAAEQPDAAPPARDVAQRRERVAAAGGEMLGAVFQFLEELVSSDSKTPAPDDKTVDMVRNRLSDCVEPQSDGRQRLTITLPDHKALDQLAGTLARLMVGSGDSNR